jgi:hypothetical protein
VGGALCVPAGQFFKGGRGIANKELSAATRTIVERRRAFILREGESWDVTKGLGYEGGGTMMIRTRARVVVYERKGVVGL